MTISEIPTPVAPPAVEPQRIADDTADVLAGGWVSPPPDTAPAAQPTPDHEEAR